MSVLENKKNEVSTHKEIIVVPLTAGDLNNPSACSKMMERIKAMKSGESVIYFRGETGRVMCGNSLLLAPEPVRPLFKMLRSMREGQIATFTQRRIEQAFNGVNTFEYIITTQ